MKFSRLFTYLFIGLLAYWVIGLFASPPPVFAAGWRDSSLGAEYDDADIGTLNFGANIDRAVKSNMGSLTCMIVPFFDLCTQDPEKYKALLQRNAVVAIGNAIDAMYTTPPADLALWVRDTGQTLGFFPKQALAQGIGFTGLQPLLDIWKVFRNIAYLILALVMIVIGFMVMFRKKIDPKTVVTVQNALPRIVVTLLLITFSYAIVGVMIDLMYVVIVLGIGILPKVNYAGGAQATVDYYLNTGFWQLISAMFNGGYSALNDIIRFINPPIVAAPRTGGAFGNIISWALFAFAWIKHEAAGAMEWVILAFFLALLLFFAVIRIFFMALGAYIQVIISILTAPLQILMDAFPGSDSFSSWFKNLVANLMVFPVTIILIHIGSLLAQSNVNNLWTPPLINAPAAAGTTTQGAAGLVGLIGLGLLLGIPSMVNSIKEALKAKPAVPMQFGLEGGGGIMQWVSSAYYIKMLAPQDIWKRIFGGKEEK